LEKRILLPHDLKPISSLAEYKKRGGLKGLEKAYAMSRAEVIEHVKQSGLRGRGGAGFPAGVKWQTVAADPSPKKYVVCNGAEGEPGTFKDRYMIVRNPYQLLEGMLICAYAVNAEQAIIGIKKKFTPQVNRLKDAIREMEGARVVAPGFLDIVLGPDDYLFGEEKALLEVIDGRGAMPRNMPPYLLGVKYTPLEHNPTVVNNAESMSHLPHIFAKGVDWFRSTGSEDTPGTIVLTLSGDVKRPGVYEVPAGLTVRKALYDLAGGPAGDKPFKAVFSGVANCVMTPDLFDTPMDFGSLRKAGVGLGSGGFIVYDEDTCMVNIALMFSRFLARSSCGQCIPCNAGCRIITEHLEKLENGEGDEEDIEDILIECGRCTSQTRCFLPTQESKMISSIIDQFPREFQNHIDYGCRRPKRPVLPKIADFDEKTRKFVYEQPSFLSV